MLGVPGGAARRSLSAAGRLARERVPVLPRELVLPGQRPAAGAKVTGGMVFDDAERGEAGGMRDGVASSSFVGAFPVSPAGFCSAAGAEPRGLNTHSPRPGREAAAETHDALWEEVGALRAGCRVSRRCRHRVVAGAVPRTHQLHPGAGDAPSLQQRRLPPYKQLNPVRLRDRD